jgi:ParB family chromosome partitioning protein
VARRSGLGKGLGALIPTEVTGDRETGTTVLLEVPIGNIVPNPHQPRTNFDEESLTALTASIRELGVLQPVLVRPLGDDRYELIAGERRWRAARRASLQTIPVLVRTVNEVTSLAQALVENLHRADLNPLEQAAAYQQLIEDFHLTHDELSQRIGKSRAAITNTLRLFQLPPAVQRLVADGQLSEGHARALLGTPDRAFQEALARRAVAEGLSVRAVESSVKARNEGEERATRARVASHLRPPGLLELEELLSGYLDTRVKVDMGPKRGKVIVEFADLEDLERISTAMMRLAPAETGD